MNNSNKKLFNKKSCATGILCCFTVAAVYAGLYREKPQVALETPSNTVAESVIFEENQPVVSNKNAVSEFNVSKDETAEIEVASVEETTVSADVTEESAQSVMSSEDETIPVMTEESSGLVWPVSGEVVMGYSADVAIYDATLDQYRTNEYVSIAAKVGETVKAAGDGTVEAVGVDPERGNMVTIKHNDGWTTTYCQLQDSITVEKGQKVKQGQIIGKVAESTMYGVGLGNHLDFKIANNTQSVNPVVALER